MTDRPILMSAPMVRALLDGRKTQTRRLAWQMIGARPTGTGRVSPTIWQSVKPGDRLWVRETWCHTGDGVWTVGDAQSAWQGKVVYRADDDNAYTSWFPSIHMPRRFSRLTLVVTATKMESVQEISEENARAEGLKRVTDGLYHYWRPDDWDGTGHAGAATSATAFQVLWQSLYTKPGARWEDNPEVVALTFTVHQRNIDAMEDAA